MIINRSTIRDVGLSAAILVLAGILQVISPRMPGIYLPVISFLIYCLVCLFTIVCIQRDLPYVISRNFLSATFGLLVIWLALELWLSTFELLTYTEMRVIWYLSYIPRLGIPFTFLLFVVSQGVLELKDIPKYWYAVIPVSLVLLAGILANDIHQAAFVLDPSGLHYEYGVWYYLVTAWIVIQFIAAAVIAMRMTPFAAVRKRSFIIWLVLAAGAFSLWLCIRDGGDVRELGAFFNLPEISTVLVLIGFEAGVRIDLFRSNYNYVDLFEASALSMAIEDGSGIRYATRNDRVEVPHEILPEARKGEYRMDRDHYVCGRRISGGWVYWVRDISPVNRLSDQLEENRSRIAQDNMLIRNENEMLARAAKADEQNTIYDMLSRETAGELSHIKELLDDLSPQQPDFKDVLAEACIYKVYVKRYCNLQLLAREQKELALFELRNSLTESMTYLRFRGIETLLSGSGDGSFRSGLILWVFHVYQCCIESCLPSLDRLTADVRAEDDFLFVEMQAHGKGIEKEETQVRQCAEAGAPIQDSIRVDSGEDSLHISLSGWKGAVV